MSYLKYLRDHFVWIYISVILIAIVDIYLLTIRASLFVKIAVSLSIFIFILIGLLFDYYNIKKFIKELELNCDSLDQKYLLPEIVQNGDNEEQRMILYILKQMEISMADRVAEYRRSNENYRDYIETWVHEVKVPIATSQMIVENHKNEAVRDTEIAGEIKRIQNYVEQALFYARSENVEKDYFIKDVNLEDIVGNVISEKRLVLREKRTMLNIADFNPEITVLSDGKWLEFIIGQIIDNSLKYSKKGESPRLDIFQGTEDGKVSLHIKDYGIGMKKSELERAFDKGFTGSNGRSVSNSTGMGLYLCNKLCLRLEHKLVINSVENEGTELIIIF